MVRSNSQRSEIELWHNTFRSAPVLDEDVGRLPSNCRFLAARSTKRKSLDQILRFEHLQGLHLYPVRAEDLPILEQLQTLKALFLYDLRVPSIEPIASLKNLQALRIMHASKLRTLQGLERLHKLRAIDIYHLPNVSSLEPLSSLSNLRELSIMMSMGTTKALVYESLAPIGQLKNLEVLKLLGVYPRDLSLRPLVALRKLRHLSLSLDHPIGEYARLVASFPPGVLKHSGPVMSRTNLMCNKCGKEKILLIGKSSKRSRQFVCPDCSKKFVDEHVNIFEQLVRDFSAKKPTQGHC